MAQRTLTAADLEAPLCDFYDLNKRVISKVICLPESRKKDVIMSSLNEITYLLHKSIDVCRDPDAEKLAASYIKDLRPPEEKPKVVRTRISEYRNKMGMNREEFVEQLNKKLGRKMTTERLERLENGQVKLWFDRKDNGEDFIGKRAHMIANVNLVGQIARFLGITYEELLRD